MEWPLGTKGIEATIPTARLGESLTNISSVYLNPCIFIFVTQNTRFINFITRHKWQKFGLRLAVAWPLGDVVLYTVAHLGYYFKY